MHSIKQKLFHQATKIEIRQHELLYLFLEITRKCNLNCRHCGSDCFKDTQSNELTTESWIKIIDYCSRNFSSQLAFVITGGEPLVSKGLEKIGEAAQRNNRLWGCVTNGLLLTKNRMNSLKQAGIGSITVSLDGTEIAHNYLRGSEVAFKNVMRALDVVGKSSIKYRDVVTCVYPSNLKELDNIAKILIDKGIPSWRLFRIFPSGRAAKDKSLILTKDQSWEMLNWISENREKYKKLGLDIDFSCEGYFPFKYDQTIRREPFFCRSGINIAAILSDGTITGCNNNQKPFFQGNILEDNFVDVWNNRFDIFRNRKKLKKGICADCKEFKYCRGGSIHLWHDLDKGPEFCYLK